eukprot:1937580-Heterocapsa_arctica.AAC.1
MDIGEVGEVEWIAKGKGKGKGKKAMTCWTCGKQGHRAAECRSGPTAKGGGGNGAGKGPGK